MWDEFYCSVSSQEKTMLTNMTHFVSMVMYSVSYRLSREGADKYE